MQYVAITQGKERRIEVTEISPGHYRIVMDGRVIEADAHAVADDTLSLIIGEQAYNIESEKDPGGTGENLLVRGYVVNAEVLDLRRLRLRHAQVALPHVNGPRIVAAPMPGKVVAVLVQEGEDVVEGQGLIVVEAMKMENELRAPKAGVVRKLAAQPGVAVEGGAALCVIE